MTEVLTPAERLRRSTDASTVNVKKAAIFAIGWWLRKLYGFKKYPDCYKAAKDNVGIKSVVFGVPRWPKKYETGKLQRQMEMFYRLMEQSIHNEDWRINPLVEQLLFRKVPYYHSHVSLDVCVELWWDCATDLNQCGTLPYSYASRALAKQVFDEELFDAHEFMVLWDSLEDSGHDFELEHLRTGKHTPACPVLRKIAGIK